MWKIFSQWNNSFSCYNNVKSDCDNSSNNHLDKIEFFNVDGEAIEKQSKHIDWDINAAEKNGYEHFMLKEIYEQPKAVKDTFSPRIKDNQIVIDELGMTDDEIRAIKKIHIVACGSA